MYAFFKPFLDLCLLSRGPQDLPSSRALLVLVALAYFAVSLAVVWPASPPGEAVATAAVDLGLLLGFAAAVLAARGYRARWVQTAEALLGSGFLLSLVAMPVIYGLYRAYLNQSDPGILAVGYLVIVGWLIAVYGNIFRHALSLKSRWSGLAVAFGYMVLSWTSIRMLFPQDSL